MDGHTEFVGEWHRLESNHLLRINSNATGRYMGKGLKRVKIENNHLSSKFIQEDRNIFDGRGIDFEIIIPPVKAKTEIEVMLDGAYANYDTIYQNDIYMKLDNVYWIKQ